jgi:hypothetical protein
MFIKKTGILSTITALFFLGNLSPSFAVGRRVISATAAKSGVKIPVTSQGVAVTIPGEEISFIQLSHLSNITCTTDNGNMCAGSSTSANILYLRTTNIYFQSQLPSPDGSTMLFIKTNGATCSSICQLQLVPSSSVPPFTVLEIGGVEPLPLARPPLAARPVSTTIKRSPNPPPPEIPFTPSQVKIDLLPPQSDLVPQTAPVTEPLALSVPVAPPPKLKQTLTPLPSEAPAKKQRETKTKSPKELPSSSAAKALIPSKKIVAYVPPKTELSSRVIANIVVRGLLVANRTHEIGFNSPVRARVQDLVRNLRKGLPLATAQKRAKLPESIVKRLLQLGGK